MQKAFGTNIDTYLRVPDTIGEKMKGYFSSRRKFLSTAV